MRLGIFYLLCNLWPISAALSAPPAVDCNSFKNREWAEEEDDLGDDLNDEDGFYESHDAILDTYNDSSSWVFSSPASQGLDERKLNSASAQLAALGNSLSFLVIRNDQIVMERYYNGAKRSDANNVHSTSKGMISAAIGKAIQDKYIRSIDQKISDFLPDYFARISDPLKWEITIRDLLTMRSGLQWREDETEDWVEQQPDWIAAMLSLPMKVKPGQKFQYSTASTHLLSELLTRATGKNTCQYVHDQILKKIGVAAEHWGSDPNGVFSGGYNVYLTPREMAKFGLLYLNEGKWKGKEILPASWVNASMSTQTIAKADTDYGFNWWVKKMKGHPVGIANGFGGQYIFVVKDLNLVVVITANTIDFDKDVDFRGVVENFVIPSAKKAILEP